MERCNVASPTQHNNCYSLPFFFQKHRRYMYIFLLKYGTDIGQVWKCQLMHTMIHVCLIFSSRFEDFLINSGDFRGETLSGDEWSSKHATDVAIMSKYCMKKRKNDEGPYIFCKLDVVKRAPYQTLIILRALYKYLTSPLQIQWQKMDHTGQKITIVNQIYILSKCEF